MSSPQAQAPKSASSIIEGGEFHCGVHEFRTKSRDEYDKHCAGQGHVAFGNAPCVYCKKQMSFSEIPHVAFGQAAGAVCDECAERYLSKAMARRASTANATTSTEKEGPSKK